MMHGLAVLLLFINHRGKAWLKSRKKDRHLLVLLPLTLVRFFLKRLKEASVCAHAHINIQTLPVPNDSDWIVEATYKVPVEFH